MEAIVDNSSVKTVQKFSLLDSDKTRNKINKVST